MRHCGDSQSSLGITSCDRVSHVSNTHGGTVPNSLMFELDCTLEPFHVFARPRTRRSGPLGLATSTAGARSFLGACCEREKREGIAIGGELCRPWDSGRSYVRTSMRVCVERLRGGGKGIGACVGW